MNIDHYLLAASKAHGVGVKEMRNHDRRAHVVKARWTAWHLAHKHGMPLAEIARQNKQRGYSCTDHTTILHGIRRLRDERT